MVFPGRLPARLRRLFARSGGLRRVRAFPEPPAYLFFCVNGAGLGHLNRGLAVARRIRRLQPDADICFLTSSPMIEVISREGYVSYHIPPIVAYGGRMKVKYWEDRMLYTYIRQIVELHRSTTFVYDGMSLYPGLLRAVKSFDFDRTAMILRLRHTHSRLEELTEAFSVFDQIIHPGEAGAGVPSPVERLQPFRVPPILYFDRSEILSRADARQQLLLPMNRRVVYVQLGAGNIDDAAAWTDHALALLSRYPDVEVVLAQSPIANRDVIPPPGVHLLRRYPNARFFNAFDLAISAAGYNTVHELLFFGVPAILIPMTRVTDDQDARARAAERGGAAVVVKRPEELAGALERVLDDGVLARFRESAMQLVPLNGAEAAARAIANRPGATVSVGGTAPH